MLGLSALVGAVAALTCLPPTSPPSSSLHSLPLLFKAFTLQSDSDTPSLSRLYYYFWEMPIFACMVRMGWSRCIPLAVHGLPGVHSAVAE